MGSIGRLRGIAVALALAGLLAAPAGAEMYRWVDEAGDLHFASDLNQVPERYRAEAREKASESTPAGANINRVSGQTDRQEALRQRVERLRRENRRGAREAENRARQLRQTTSPAATVEPPKPPPRKYRRDCSRRNANGRCARVQTREFREWKAGQGR